MASVTSRDATPAPDGPSPWLSRLARDRKLRYFFDQVPPGATILELGCADGWVGRWAARRGHRVLGVDVRPPADIVGDIRAWRSLGLPEHGFDVIIAFEVLEHGEFSEVLHDLLEPDGRLMVTTPVPRLDWACRIGEAAGVLQRRTSPHSHLLDVRRMPRFVVVERRIVGLVSQWAVLRPVRAAP